MAKLALVNGIPRMVAEAGATTIYDETTVLEAGVSTGVPVTLPASGSYNSEELEVWLNNIRLESVVDYNYEGSPARTQVSFTFDLVVGDSLRFRIDRSP